LTLIVGILCSDGAAIASDSAATYSTGIAATIGQQEVKKVHQLGTGVLYGATGSVGISQLLQFAIENTWNASLKGGQLPSAQVMVQLFTAIATATQAIRLSAAQMVPLVGNQAAGASALCKSMVALPVQGKVNLFQFDFSGAPEAATEQLPFISMGVGQPIADPFLAFLNRILWKGKQPTIAEGRFVAAWTVKHVSETIPGGVGGPLQMASLSMKDGQPLIEFVEDPAEHFQKIEAAERALENRF
jgi:20S proteasome alpha/beta subunit